jgi:glutathione S-transferase
MEAHLSTSPWLAGESFSLADTAMLPYVMRLEMLHMSATWGRSRLPRVERWLAACQNRPSFQLALWKWMPSQLTEDLKNNGIRSWPEVARILGID